MTRAHTTRYATLLGLVLALALAAVLMACGGDSPEADGERAAATPQTEAGEPEPTRQGIFGSGSQSTAEPEEAADEPTATRRPLPTFGPTSAATDRDALVALYNATAGPNWDDNDNWSSDAPIGEWYGVTTGLTADSLRTSYRAGPLG